MAGTECSIGEEQHGFRQGAWIRCLGVQGSRGNRCMDQVFAVRLREKYLANWKNVFRAFAD